MKFLLVTDLFPKFPGGAENHVFRILKELQRRGHEVSCVCNHIKDLITSEEAGFPVMKLPKPNDLGTEWGKINDCTRQYGKWIVLTPEQREYAHSVKRKMMEIIINKLGKPDAVITHTYFAFLFHDELKSLGVPISCIAYNGRVFSDFDFNLHVSKCRRDDKKVMQDLYGAPPQYKKAELDENDLILYPICKKEPLSVHEPEFDVGQIKLIGHKDPDTFWKLARDFPDKKFLVVRGEWGWHDVIPGEKDGYGEMRPGKVPPNVTLIPPVKDIVKDFFSKIKVYLHTAIFEDFGMAALEAQFLGIPVISRPKLGLLESVGNGGEMGDNYNRIKYFVKKMLEEKEYYESCKRLGFEHAKIMQDKTMKQYDKWLEVLNAN